MGQNLSVGELVDAKTAKALNGFTWRRGLERIVFGPCPNDKLVENLGGSLKTCDVERLKSLDERGGGEHRLLTVDIERPVNPFDITALFRET